MEAKLERDELLFTGGSHVAVVKNTFIQVLKPGSRSARRLSLPASLHLCTEYCDSICDSNSDSSIAASPISPISCDAERERATTWCVSSMSSEQSIVQPPMSWQQSASIVGTSKYGKPKSKLLGACQPHHKARIDKAIRRVANILKTSDLVTQVDIDEESLTISVHVASESFRQQALSHAQKTLLEVTTQSKCIYIMGYASSSPFRVHADGFEVTIGLMENASRACWHVFKKGFCRHGVNCSKQHPVFEVPLQVAVTSDVGDIFCF